MLLKGNSILSVCINIKEEGLAGGRARTEIFREFVLLDKTFFLDRIRFRSQIPGIALLKIIGSSWVGIYFSSLKCRNFLSQLDYLSYCIKRVYLFHFLTILMVRIWWARLNENYSS